MSVILLVLGILITGAGIVTIGYGISINESSLGNALIIAGTTTFSAGLILVAIAAAVGQLSEIARALRPPRAQARPQQGRPAELTEPSALPATLRAAPSPGLARNPAAPKPKIEERIPEPATGEGAAQVSASAIERLRSSLVRADRKPPNPVETEQAPLAPAPPEPVAPVVPAAAKGTNGASPPAGVDATEEPKKAPLDFLFRGKQREAPSDSFDSVWPRRPQGKDDQAGAKQPAKGGRERPWPPDADAPAAEEPRQPAILKSGVVDGMAYTLYADGSIEAQLPQGTVRFGSIAELRAHIENNS
jgi:hypothetical protein